MHSSFRPEKHFISCCANIFKSCFIPDFYGFGERITELEQKLHSFIKNDELEKASELILDTIPEAVKLTEKYVPESALKALKIKFALHWPDGSGVYYSHEDNAQQRVTRERIFGFEKELLSAHNPRRVQKLFEEAKPRLEKMYGTEFVCGEYVAIMNGLYENRKKLEEKTAGLQNVLSRLNLFKDFSKKYLNFGWEEITDMWRHYRLRQDTVDSAIALVGLMKDVKNPSRLLHHAQTIKQGDGPWEEEVSDACDLLYTQGHGSILISDFDHSSRSSYHDHVLDYLSAILIAGKVGNLDFKSALNIVSFDWAKNAGMLIEEYRSVFASVDHDQAPKRITEIVDETLTRHYHNRQPGDDCSRFMRHLANFFLERWKATAVDYDLLFDFYVPEHRDLHQIDFFYRIRDGKRPAYDDERACKGRLTDVLRLLVQDGVLKENEIDPPLRKKYLLPDEMRKILSSGKLLTDGKGTAESLNLPMKYKPAVIATKANPVKLIPEFTEKKLPALRDDLSALAGLLDPNGSYYVLFKGNHTLFLAKEEHWPNGNLALHDIHRIALLEDNANPADGAVIKLRGQRFYVRKEKSLDEQQKLRNAIYSSKTDLVPVQCYTFVTSATPEEFRQNYFKDFMAPVMLNRPWLDAESVIRDLNRIDDMPATGLNVSIGPTGHTSLRTFEVSGRFAFQLKYDSGMFVMEEILSIALELKDYIEGVGLGIHQEIGLDEYGRARVKRKLEDRIFYQENFAAIAEALKGPKLADALAAALAYREYNFHNLGESYKPCEHCGKKYVDGNIYRPDLREQWCEGIRGDELHAISRHPETFEDEFSVLRKIMRMLTDIKPAEQPIIFSHPGLMPEFDSFARAYEDSAKADSASFDFGMNTCGGLSHIEDEDLEDNAELRELSVEESSLHRKINETATVLETARDLLQKKYESLKGIAASEAMKDEDIWKNLRFWADQFFLFDIYSLAAPELTERFAESWIMKNPSKLVRDH